MLRLIFCLLLSLFSLQLNLAPAWAALERTNSLNSSVLASPAREEIYTLDTKAYSALPPDPVPPPPRPFCGEACWSASFFLPGSGQLFLGESLRGWGFMAGTLIAPWALSTLSMAVLEIGKVPGWSGAELQQAVPFFIVAATLATISMYIWNIFDAYGIQTEKNAAWQSALETLENWQPQWVETPVTGQERHWHLQVSVGHF